MRWIGVILTATIVAGLAGSANGQQSGCAGCNGKTPFAHASPWAMDGAPCCSPPGYALAPGCCEYSRHCCDNAWAGYCEHRARVEAFWARVGVPKPRYRFVAISAAPATSCPGCPSPTPAVQSVSAKPSVPASPVARPKPATPSVVVSPVLPPMATEKKPARESTGSLLEWRF